jgi:hypothetical protein
VQIRIDELARACDPNCCKAANEIPRNAETAALRLTKVLPGDGIEERLPMRVHHGLTRTALLAVVAAFCAVVPPPASAVYNANLSGVLAFVSIYADGDYIYLALNNQPTSHPGCNPAYFVIDGAVPLERRQMMLARLLTSYATKEVVNIGYDNVGDCVHGYIRVHRVG